MRHLFARFSAALTLCLAMTACGSATAPNSSRLLSQLEDKPKVTTVEIFYWNNKNLGFGHVAAGLTGSGPEGTLWAMITLPTCKNTARTPSA